MSGINIIGAGVSGLTAAITLAERGIPCELVSLQPSERAQSVLAEGGMNAALDLMGEGDSPAEHYADTMRGGVFLADPNAVAGLTEAAPALARRLSAFGVPFQMEDGRLVQRRFGGQQKRRTLYAKSSTGKAVMTALIDEARRHEASGLIRRHARHELLAPALRDGRCVGAWVDDTLTGGRQYLPGPVILCTGGLNGLFPGMTTGTTQNSGDAVATVFSQGAELANLEFIQYHPTTVHIPGKRLLISEAARGEGGRLFVLRDGARFYFMAAKYPDLGDLMPRDVISREMALLGGEQTYLDLTGLPARVWRERLPDLREELRHYLGLDPAKKPVPVGPGIHFFMGGVRVDEGHRTSIPGLYAAGECACQYHGANRLGGNSLLAALYGGGRAAQSAAAQPLGGSELPPQAPADAGTVSPRYAARLAAILRDGLGILRDGDRLARALDELDALAAESRSEREARRAALGRAMLLSAMARRESRGAHTRTDYPERDDAAFAKTTVAVRQGDGITITFRDIPARRDA